MNLQALLSKEIKVLVADSTAEVNQKLDALIELLTSIDSSLKGSGHAQ